MNFLFHGEVIDYIYINSQSTKTIVFLHGWGGDKFSFASTINLFKKEFNILTLTMPTTKDCVSFWTMFDYSNLVENLLAVHNISKPIIICHSFGFRVATVLNQKLKFSKIVVTAGAGAKKNNILYKIDKNNSVILLKNSKFEKFFENFASKDYKCLSKINKQTFKNVVNFNTLNMLKFNMPILLFWGKKDKDTKIWIAKKIKKQNKSCELLLTNGDHFTYLEKNSLFNYKIKEFLND